MNMPKHLEKYIKYNSNVNNLIFDELDYFNKNVFM